MSNPVKLHFMNIPLHSSLVAQFRYILAPSSIPSPTAEPHFHLLRIREPHSPSHKMIPQPKPRKKWRFKPQDEHGLAVSMRLSASAEDRNLYCRIVQDVAKVYDKHKQRMKRVHTGSGSAAWKWFLEQVHRVHPTLAESYEFAWPVILIVREHRRQINEDRRGPRPGLSSWTRYVVKCPPSVLVRGPAAQNPASRSTQPVNHRHHPSVATGLPADVDSSQRSRAARSKPFPSRAVSASSYSRANSAVSTRTRSSVARRHGGAAPTSLNQNTQSAGAGVAGGQCEIDDPESADPAKQSKPDSLLGFLEWLRPPQPALLPVFVRLGVTSAAELRELPFVAKWLHDRVKEELITELQFAALRAGLQKLGEQS